ncbi:MAG: Trm112 family protein [Candidatus Aenigmarchaeota archaeon]|nr:Trm112 family protein [Candidatus Aenigmarchaeota archaeon]
MTVSKELLDIMACPKCKKNIRHDEKENKIVCDKCRLKFPILEGDIPNMLIEDAEKF